jgi:hypothetical protein
VDAEYHDQRAILLRPSTGYKIVGGVLIAFSVLGIVLVLSGATPRAPGWLPAVIGFLLYLRGMRLAVKESDSQLPSVHFAVISAWLQQLVRRLRGRA